MFPYQKTDILAIYRNLLEIANNYSEKGHWKKSIDYLSSAAKWAYQFNFFYTDNTAESLVKRICYRTINPVEIKSPDNDKYVLLDSFCMDNRGLTQQYLRAMIHNKVEILYICTSKSLDNGEDILQELNNYPKARLLLFDKDDSDSIGIAKKTADEIARYCPAHLFLHIAPWDVAALMSCCAVSGVVKYNINLTDHAYWMGASLIDYNIEFRPYGKTVSLEKRGLKSEQLLELPFFPVDPIGHPFRGLPSIPDNAVKIMTGGAMYKMLGKDDIFFSMMEQILSIAPNVYILVAGFTPNKTFGEKCSKVKGNDRILVIGSRDDIDSVFQECDIFLSTYPTSGGLMCQYAAKYGKPMLAYRDPDDVENAVEEMVNHFGGKFRSFIQMNDLMDYARHLISDEQFRADEGASLAENVMTSDKFYHSFVMMVNTRRTQWQWNLDHIDYDTFANRYLDLENTNGFMASKCLLLEGGFTMPFHLRGYKKQFLLCLIDLVKWSSVKKRLKRIIRSNSDYFFT